MLCVAGIRHESIVSLEHVQEIAEELVPDPGEYNSSYESCQEFVFRLADEIMVYTMGIMSTSTKSLLVAIPFIIINAYVLTQHGNFSWVDDVAF